MSEERLQRLLARAGIASRRKAEELIREGRVTVNGQVAEIGAKADPGRDAVKVDGKRVQPQTGPGRYILLNKPRGVMSTVADPQGRRTVLDLIPPALRKALVPVGRLDYETEGLILLTDDGDFAEHVAHPRYGGVKTYEVKVKGEPSQAVLDRLREGIVIDGKRTVPARIKPRQAKGSDRRRRSHHDDDEGHNTWWIVELTEGRTRQIREMFVRIGHPVQKLRRVAIGPLKDPHMPLGTFRELTEREVETLRRITAKPKKRAAPPKKRTAPHPPGPPLPRALPAARERGEKAPPRKAPAVKKKATPAKKAAPHPRPLSHRPPVPRERGEQLATTAAPRKKAAPARKGAPAKRSAPAKKGAPAKRSAPAKRAAPARKAGDRRAAARKTSGKRPGSGPRRSRG